jgi:hypothetical protein
VPPWQTCAVPHWTPQPPQFALSADVFAQYGVPPSGAQ